jgi:hypothetical protein
MPGPQFRDLRRLPRGETCRLCLYWNGRFCESPYGDTSAFVCFVPRVRRREFDEREGKRYYDDGRRP